MEEITGRGKAVMFRRPWSIIKRCAKVSGKGLSSSKGTLMVGFREEEL